MVEAGLTSYNTLSKRNALQLNITNMIRMFKTPMTNVYVSMPLIHPLEAKAASQDYYNYVKNDKQ